VGAQIAHFTAVQTAAARLGDDVNDGRYRASSGAQRNLQSVTGGQFLPCRLGAAAGPLVDRRYERQIRWLWTSPIAVGRHLSGRAQRANLRAFLGADDQQPRNLTVAALAQVGDHQARAEQRRVYALSGRCMLAKVMVSPSFSKRSS
jgi:hypothetical protein